MQSILKAILTKGSEITDGLKKIFITCSVRTFNASVTAIDLAILACLLYDFGLICLYSVVFCFVL